MALTLMYITNSPEVAVIAQECGVNRIWIDLETLGKELRQKNFDSVKSHHSIEDIKKIKPLLVSSEMLVRVNPWNENSAEEIDSVIAAGADLVMLPMWEDVGTVKNFVQAVNKRAKTVLLLETRGAEACLDEVLKLSGIDEIHIGLNDLHIQYGMKFMFELLANGTIDRLCKKISGAGLPYGFGGIAKLGYGDVPAELVISEHYRLGSTRTILSRAFCDTAKINDIDEVRRIFREESGRLRDYEVKASQFTADEFEINRKKLAESVMAVVAGKERNCV